MNRPSNKNRPTGKKSTVPTEDDWGDYRADLEMKDAHDFFAGRTNEEMQPHFRRNPLSRRDDLLFMPEVPFRYYMLGYRDFVMAGSFDEGWAPSVASCFMNLILAKLEQRPQYILPIMPDLLPTIEHVARNQAAFGDEEEIYGNFLEKGRRIRSLYADLADSK